jgi:hypothetical protein
MIVAFGLPEATRPALEAQLPSGVALRPVRSFNRAELLLRRASGFVLTPGAAPPDELLRRLRLVRLAHPWLPIVVAGEHGPAADGVAAGADAADGATGVVAPQRTLADGEALARAGADLIVPPSLAHQGPDGAGLAAEWRRLPLRRLAAMVDRVDHIAEGPRQLMVSALCAPRPVRSLHEVAAFVDRHRSSLWKLWRTSRRPLPSVGIFLDWLQLLHVAVRKDSGRSWRAVTLDVGARPSSISRLGRRVLGRPLSTFDVQVRQRLFRAFLGDMLLLTRPEVRALIEQAPSPLPPLLDPVAPLPRRRRQRRAAAAEAEAELARCPRDTEDEAPADGAASDARPAASSAANARRSVAGSWRRADEDVTMTPA